MLRIKTIESSVFFIQEKNELLQAADIVVENPGATCEARVEVRRDSKEKNTVLGKVEHGEGKYRVYVPDIQKETPVEFTIKVSGKAHDRRKTTWTPRRHWQVCMIPIAHHDFGYTDTIENVLRQYDGFYDDVLRFCEETADWPEEAKFRYMVEGAWSIQHFVENRPKEVLARLEKHIKEGRIEIPALWGNEISALCGHEELIRLMYPSFRLKREYGAKISTASITDIPGLSWGLATVLAGAGVKYFFAGMPTYFEWRRNDIHTFWDERAILPHGRPDAFRWLGPDGESVLVYYQGGYGCWSPSSLEEALDQLPGKLEALEQKGCPFSVARYGYGCGDNVPPDIRISCLVREWNNRWAYPKLLVATHSMFFEMLARECRDVRVFRGELPDTDYVVGALSTAKETGINRATHDRLCSAEKFAAIASLIGDSRYPAEKIREAYDNLLLYDEHTWGMSYPIGEAQDWNWSDKSRCAYKAAGLTGAILSESLNRIASSISLQEEGRHIAVFNSLSFDRTDVARVPRFVIEGPFDLIDEETGGRIPCQIVAAGGFSAPAPYAAQRYARGQFDPNELFDLVFVAENVPSLGYKTYRIRPKEQATPARSGVSVGETSLENRFFRVALSPQTGVIESIYDKELSREIVDERAPHKLNQLIAKWVKSGCEESPQKATIRKGEDGPVYGSLVVSSGGAGCPQLTQEIILYEQVKRIDIQNRILKDSTPLMAIYFAFPFKIEPPKFCFEGSNSVITPLVDQFPGSNSNYYTAQHWADVSNAEIGVTFAPIEAHLVEFGGLWPCYVSQAHHGVQPADFGREFLKPGDLTKGHIYSYVLDSNFRTNFQPAQQGDMLFRYSITTHRGNWKEGRASDFGWGTGNPLIPICMTGGKDGTLGKSAGFMRVNESNVRLLAMKQAEDGDGIIVRLMETEGKESAATVTLPFLTVEKALKTNLVEENEGPLQTTPHAVTAAIRAFGIATMRIQARRY